MTVHDDTCAWTKKANLRPELEVTGAVFYCTEHQAAMDTLMARISHMLVLPAGHGIINTALTQPKLPDDSDPPDLIDAMISFMKKWEGRDVPRTPTGIVAEQLQMSTIPMSVEQLAVRIVDALRDHLQPEPEETFQEYGVRWHGEDTTGIRLSETKLRSHEEAVRIGCTKIGQYGILQFTVERREHRSYPDGSTWSGPWTPAGGTIRPEHTAQP